jgi:hypothetical protein
MPLCRRDHRQHPSRAPATLPGVHLDQLGPEVDAHGGLVETNSDELVDSNSSHGTLRVVPWMRLPAGT